MRRLFKLINEHFIMAFLTVGNNMLRLYILTFMLYCYCYRLISCQYATTKLRSIPCPDNINAIENFDMANFSGIWYTAYMYYNLTGPVPDCQYTNVLKRPDGTYFGISTQMDNHTSKYYDYNFNITSADERGKINLVYDLSHINETVELEPYITIVDTDYFDYAIRYTCYQQGNVTLESSAILMRERNLTEERNDALLTVAEIFDIDIDKLSKVRQESCPEENIN